MVIFIPISLGLGWYLVSPLFLPGALSEAELDLSEVDVLSTGELVQIDSQHHGTGTVYIVENQQSAKFVLFEDVVIANGPALYVYLSDKSTFSGISDSAGTFYDLGPLAFTRGNFNVSIPNEVVVSDYQSVLIWCQPFNIVFTWATLQVP